MTSTEHNGHEVHYTTDASGSVVAICSCGSASDDFATGEEGIVSQFKAEAWTEAHFTETSRSTGW